MLLFDLGGVLVDIAIFESLAVMLGEPADGDELRDRWLRSQAVRALELGQIEPDEFSRRFVAEWAIPLTPQAFLAEFSTWLGEPYPGAVELLAELRQRHHVSCLSNCNPAHWSRLAWFLECFDSAFSSHLLGEIKPDPQIFETVLCRLGVDAPAVRFYDDSRANVEAARALGIEAFLVRDFDHLRRLVGREGA